jgi:galactokinase
MTEAMRTTIMGSIGSILSRVPVTAEEPDNVVSLPRPTLDDLERELIDARNAVISAGVECDRAAMIYTERLRILEAARVRMAERMKEVDGKLEFTRQYPEIES